MDNYTHRYSLTAADMDTRYRMTSNAVLLYYQDCWARYMACLNLAAFDVVKEQRLWVITEFNAWFTQQTALWSDDIEVIVWNSEISNLRLYADFRIRRQDGIEVAHGYGCWTLLDTEAHRPAPITPFLSRIPILPELTCDSHKKRRFATEGSLLQQFEHTVTSIDLDFNGHTNNRTYLHIAMQSANETFMDTYALSSLTIRWQKESFFGNTLQCRLLQLPRESAEQPIRYLHTITCNNDKTAAQIYSEWQPRTEQIDISTYAKRE